MFSSERLRYHLSQRIDNVLDIIPSRELLFVRREAILPFLGRWGPAIVGRGLNEGPLEKQSVRSRVVALRSELKLSPLKSLSSRSAVSGCKLGIALENMSFTKNESL